MTVPTAGEQTCPRCGASTAGAPWCPACGLNLRLHTPEAPETPLAPETAPAPDTAAPPTAAQPPPPPPPMSVPPAPRSDRSRKRVAAVVGGILVLGGAIAAVAVLASRSSSPRPAAAAKTVVKTVADTVVVTDGGASTPLVTVDEMHSVLNAYVQAYADESTAELDSLFAPNLVRKNGTDPIEHHDAALRTYQQQFDNLTHPQYQLSGIQYRTGQGAGTAGGNYAITSSNAGVSQGSIGFAFVVQGGRLLIDAIRVSPS